MPVVIPVMMPLLLPMVAVPLLVLQVPPRVPSLSSVGEPVQIVDGPVMGPTEGSRSIVIVLVAEAVPQAPLTV